jgi:hypothetical protein
LLFEQSSYLAPQVVGQTIRGPSVLHDPVNSYMNGLICACYRLNASSQTNFRKRSRRRGLRLRHWTRLRLDAWL